MEIFTIENLTFKYGGASECAVNNLSFSVNEGDFVILCGSTGCGKTTLLRLMKKELMPYGTQEGRVLYRGCDVRKQDSGESVKKIGFCFQNPDNQIVTDRVYHELAFGLENLGTPVPKIKRKAAELSEFFGINSWFYRDTASLSGGQKQILNLACIMMMNPDVLLLDEPLAQLDPVAAADFLSVLQRLNRDLGVTVVMAEHRLENTLSMCGKAAVMEGGRLMFYGSPSGLSSADFLKGSSIYAGLPAAYRICQSIGAKENIPLTVREGREYFNGYFRSLSKPPVKKPRTDKKQGAVDKALVMEEVYFRYEKNGPDILKGMNLTIREGEIFCLLGGNGAGKSTALMAAMGQRRIVSGRVKIFGKPLEKYRKDELYGKKAAYLPQNARMIFVKNKVIDDFLAADLGDTDSDAVHKKVYSLAHSMGIENLLECNPLDLSGGELQKCAVARLLLGGAKLLLLDEPTKGLDPAARGDMCEIFRSLCAQGTAFFVVTHDIDFAAHCAGRCGLMFDGNVTGEGTPGEFFSRNMFYTTAANSVVRDYLPDAVTCEEVEERLRGTEKSQ